MTIRVQFDFAQRYPDASPLATECAMNLVFTADLLTKRIATLLQPFDLTPASGLVLSILANSGEPLPPNVIAERLIITRATVTGLVDSLERRGYVERQPSQTDRRMILVCITEAGRRTAETFRPIVHARQKEWFDALSGEDQRALLGMLFHVQQALMP